MQNKQVLTYQQTLNYLYARLPVFHRIGAAALKPGLGNIIALCNSIDNPQNSFETIHIAGTNGKGSTSHYLAAILQAAGYKTGLYTSPHVKDFRERIRVNGQMISKDFVVKFVAEKMPLYKDIDASFFELTVALAFDYFRKKKVDIAIIETGLGGRLDSTNIISPRLSIITNIGYDHMDLLGNTLAAIASEKAGIIKPNTPVVVGERNNETEPVFITKAKTEKAPIIFAEEVFNLKKQSQSALKLVIEANNKSTKKISTYTSQLTGNYQLKNIATVLTAVAQLRQQGYVIPEKAVKEGLGKVVSITGLLGRWQVINQKPYTVADTGHNYDGLKQTMQQLKELKKELLHIVFGVVADKDLDKVLPLLPKKAHYYFCKPNLMRGLDASILKEKAAQYGLKGDAYASCKKAYNAAKMQAIASDTIYIGGSTFVVGEII